jgi:hypothetical protein
LSIENYGAAVALWCQGIYSWQNIFATEITGITEKKVSPLCSAAYFTFLKTSGRFASHCFKLSL